MSSAGSLKTSGTDTLCRVFPECKGIPSFSPQGGSEQSFFCSVLPIIPEKAKELKDSQHLLSLGVRSVSSLSMAWVFNPTGAFPPWLGVTGRLSFGVTGQLSTRQLEFQTGVRGLRQPCGPLQLGQFSHYWQGEEDVEGGSWYGHDGWWPDHSACEEAGLRTHRQESDL